VTIADQHGKALTRPATTGTAWADSAAILWLMTWSWQFEKEDGTLATVRGLTKEAFGSQGDAESWIGENWRSLLELGVDQVTLLDDGEAVYQMSLHPAG
jgi:hypothetical protein